MANKERGELTFVAGPNRYVLRLTTNSCCELEELAGRLWPSILSGGQRGSLRDVRFILWAALREHHPDLATIDQAGIQTVGKVIDAGGGVLGIHAQVRALLALNADSGEKVEDSPGNAGARPPAAQAGTGVSSTLTH